MILFASGRTDIPAFYSKWFANRIRAGFVDVRNPYFPQKVTRYELNPELVDCIVFCTKNPRPAFEYLEEFKKFGIYFFVTITPYENDIEPNVPEKSQIIEDFIELSKLLGKNRVCWRYDPILITEKYSAAFHIRRFREMCEKLSVFTDRCIISFVDLYSKTKRNFPDLKEVCEEDQIFLAQTLSTIAERNGIQIESCAEKMDLSDFGVKIGACISREILENATGIHFVENGKQILRKHCQCVPTRDIAHYNCCPHLCRYCYANYDAKSVQKNFALHDDESSFLIGHSMKGDEINFATQESWKDSQLRLF